MHVARGRTITILDTGGIVFSRIWCVYELFLTLIDAPKNNNGGSNDGVWAVYTAQLHTDKDRWGKLEETRKAVRIISGGATVDGGDASKITARE